MSTWLHGCNDKRRGGVASPATDVVVVVVVVMMLTLCCGRMVHASDDKEQCRIRPSSVPRILDTDTNTFVTIDAEHFPLHYGSYPPSSSNSGATNDGNHEDSTRPQQAYYYYYYYILHEQAPVLYVTDFLNQSDAQELRSFCQDRFVPSNIRGRGAGTTVAQSELRTSESCSMVPAMAYKFNPRFQALLLQQQQQQQQDNSQAAAVAREADLSWEIATRASRLLTGTTPELVEPLQLVRYTSPNQAYQLHHDHGGYYGKATEHRSWTMLIFLNTLEEEDDVEGSGSAGGHTSFPELGMEVVPRGGDALVWRNVLDDDERSVNPAMVHMGKPPEREGVEKYAVNVWFGMETLEERVSQIGAW